LQTIGIKGGHISGGQKQRLCIGRTLLRKPIILLLDEATSALDSSNEDLVVKALKRMNENLTIITIAHRFETIKDYDKILVFLDGKIV
jgi:ABC-type multidrug transport system fused ATPase/permease subunit